MKTTESPPEDRLWRRYWSIVDGRKPGFARPIAWYCALRGQVWAMLELSSRFVVEGHRSDPFSGAGLCYRAWRAGSAFGAQHQTRLPHDLAPKERKRPYRSTE